MTVPNCPVCGKKFFVQFTDLWAYRRGHGKKNSKYICSWSCLRQYDKDHEKVKEESVLTKVTLADKKKAVQIALDGGDPREFLKDKCKDPRQMWNSIKGKLKDADPETHAKLPTHLPYRYTPTPEGEYVEEKEDHSAMEAVENMGAAADEFFGKCEEAGVKIDGPITITATEPEKVKINKPLHYDGFKVKKIEGVFGRYSVDTDGVWFYFEEVTGDEIGIQIERMPEFISELKRAAAVLGVDPDE